MFPFIAALTQAGGIIIDKIALTRRRMEIHVFVPLLFLMIFLLCGLIFPFFAQINNQIFQYPYNLCFFLMIVTAVIWNIYYYKGVQSEKVHEFQLIVMFQPLLTILLAAMIFPIERNPGVIFAALTASVTLILAHFNKEHLEFSKGSWYLVIAIVFMSIELILTKILLNVISPVAFYFVRTGILAIFFLLFYHPEIYRVSKENLFLILLTSTFGVIQMITKFYGFEIYGVVYTSLILLLAPILVYFVSTVWLHEKLKFKTVLSALVIFGCVVYATILGK